MNFINQDYIKSILNYDEITGIFAWKINIGNRTVGDSAGCIDKSTGYVRIKINKKSYRAHRLAFIYSYGDILDKLEIDHINHIRSDNRISNLRKCTASENHRNKSLCSLNTTGFNGVVFVKEINRYKAKIKVDGKTISLGYFEDIEDAIKSRNDANIKYGFHENHGSK